MIRRAPAAEPDELIAPRPWPRPWPVKLMNLLLLLEAAVMLSIALLHDGPLGLPDSPGVVDIIQAIISNLAYTTIFGGLAVLAVVAAIGFWRLWPIGWSLAILVQGLSLVVALVLYFTSRPFYTQLLMLFIVVLVVYLRHSDIQTTFQTRAAMMNREER
jgi:hypothetical protein